MTRNSFSIRNLIDIQIPIQIQTINDSLKTRIWNCFCSTYFVESINKPGYFVNYCSQEQINYVVAVWDSFFCFPLDELPSINNRAIIEKFHKRFWGLAWNNIFDFIEFSLNNYNNVEMNKKFSTSLNDVLEEERSGYRVIKQVVVEITSPTEIETINKAVLIPIVQPQTHLIKALQLMSNREKPDYPNSIKESISSVESLVRILNKNEKTLGQGIKEIAQALEISGILADSLSKIYGYTSAEPGTRHGASEEIRSDFDDAKFILIICSGWLNYIYARALKKGLIGN